MFELIVRSTCMLIRNYDLGDCPELERCFQVYDPITHSYDTLGMYYSGSTKTLYIPRGLDIWKIKKYLNITNHKVEPPEPFLESGPVMMKYKPRDYQQIETISFMTGINQYEENYAQPQLSVNLPTGKGKTYCSIASFAFMQIKSIVITGSNTLLSQWKNNIKEYTNLKDKDILFISGSEMMLMILEEKSKKAKDAKIYLCTHATIRSFCDNYGWSKLSAVFTKLGIGIKIIDEAHTNFANMLMVDFFTNVFKTFYVTATPERSSWNENKIYQLSMKNVPYVELFDEDKDPHTDYVAIKWNSHPTARDLSYCSNFTYGLDRMKYVNYLFNNDNFYKIMRFVMDIYLKMNGRGLFYVATNDGVLKLYKWISENYPQLLGQIGIYTSLLTKEQKLLEKGKKLIISTTKSAGLGEHIEGLKLTVVVAEPFKSEVIAKQTLGRTRDKDTLYIELVDMGFKHIRKYYYAKLPVFNKYAKSVSDTQIDQYELEKRTEKFITEQQIKIDNSPFIFEDRRFFHYEHEPWRRDDKKIVKPFTFINNDNNHKL